MPIFCYSDRARHWKTSSHNSLLRKAMTIILKEKADLVVPPSVRRPAGIKAGDRLEFKTSLGMITIVAKPVVAANQYSPRQSRSIDAQLAESLQDVEQGWVGPFPSVAELERSLLLTAKESTS